MGGMRPLKDDEVRRVIEALGQRGRALFVIGVYTGLRISEILSLNVGDVWKNGAVVSEVVVQRRNIKGRKSSRVIPLHPKAATELADYIKVLVAKNKANAKDPLFEGRYGRHLSRFAAWREMKVAFATAGLVGQLATHSMRKTFAERMYELLEHDLLATRDALGHADISSTVRYIEVRADKVKDAILRQA